jgi:hypothetical protein
MRAVSIIVLWLTAVAVVFTLLVFGLVQHYWYFNDTTGLGYDVIKWQGQKGETELDETIDQLKKVNAPRDSTPNWLECVGQGDGCFFRANDS